MGCLGISGGFNAVMSPGLKAAHEDPLPAFTQSPLMTEAFMEKPYVSYTQHLPKAAWDKLAVGTG